MKHLELIVPILSIGILLTGCGLFKKASSKEVAPKDPTFEDVGQQVGMEEFKNLFNQALDDSPFVSKNRNRYGDLSCDGTKYNTYDYSYDRNNSSISFNKSTIKTDYSLRESKTNQVGVFETKVEENHQIGNTDYTDNSKNKYSNKWACQTNINKVVYIDSNNKTYRDLILNYDAYSLDELVNKAILNQLSDYINPFDMYIFIYHEKVNYYINNNIFTIEFENDTLQNDEYVGIKYSTSEKVMIQMKIDNDHLIYYMKSKTTRDEVTEYSQTLGGYIDGDVSHSHGLINVDMTFTVGSNNVNKIDLSDYTYIEESYVDMVY